MEFKQTLLDQILQQILILNDKYEKSNENKKVHLIELNPGSYKTLKKEIEMVINKPIKKSDKLFDCKIEIVKDMQENFKII